LTISFFEALGFSATTLLNLCAIPGDLFLANDDFYFLSSIYVLMLTTPSRSGVGDSDMTGIEL